MIRCLFLRVAGIIALISVASTACRIARAAEESASEEQRLMIGDWYKFSVQRGDAKAQVEGHLISFDDEWIVLGVLSEGAQDIDLGTPVLKEIPVVGRLFQKPTRIAACAKCYRWAPRQAAKIESRTIYADHSFWEPFRNDIPKLADTRGRCEISTVEHPDSVDGGFLGLLNDHIRLATGVEKEVIKGPETTWTRLPLVGEAFRTDQVVARQVVKDIPLSNILFIETQVAYAPPAAKVHELTQK